MASADIVGSWFPSGYYGHFRSKSRNDFIGEYRQLAKPQPPRKFYNRSKQPTPRHVFSHHDNRESFLNSALYFEQGLGRKRVPNDTYSFKKDFVTWMPEQEYIERSRPLVSTYRVDFKKKSESCKQVPQIIVKRPKTSFEGTPTTSYRYSHSGEAPNKESINAMNNEALKLSLLNRKDRAMSAKSSGRESVASCLVWYNAEREKTKAPVTNGNSRVPAATPTMVHVPHPPQQQCSSNAGFTPAPPSQPAPHTMQQTAPPTVQQASQQMSQLQSASISNEHTAPSAPQMAPQPPSPVKPTTIAWAQPTVEVVCG